MKSMIHAVVSSKPFLGTDGKLALTKNKRKNDKMKALGRRTFLKN